MKVSVFELQPWEREAFERLADMHDVRTTEEPLNEETVGEHRDAEVVSTFVYSDVTGEILGKMEDLRLVATRSTGFDHIDTNYCEQSDVAVANVPSYGRNTVAEHAFALLLSVARHLRSALECSRINDFSRQGLLGFDLMGKTIGVIGTGDIGKHAVQIAKGFGMEVLAFDVKRDEQFAEEMGFPYVSMDELLSRSDVVTLHVPANPKTEHMIDEDALGKMKDGAVLINTSRGRVVDGVALLGALTSGKLAGAGLDVLEGEDVLGAEEEIHEIIEHDGERAERLLADEQLMHLDNVVLTPHSAFFTREAVQRIADTTVDNVLAWGRGQPENLVVEAPVHTGA